MKLLTIPLCCILASCATTTNLLSSVGLAPSQTQARPVAGYSVDRPKPTLTSVTPLVTALPVKDVLVYQPSSVAPAPMASAAPGATPPATMPATTTPLVSAVAMPNAAPTPLSTEPPAAVPPTAAPLPLAASLGVGQGEGLPPEVPAVPVAPIPQTMGLAEAVARLATHHNITSDVKIAGAPEVTISGEPPALSAGLSALLAAATPRHYAAIVRDRSGTPVRIIVSPYPIIGATN